MTVRALERLTPAIAEVFDAGARGRSFCATFAVLGDERRFIQVTRTELNVAYPHARDPAASVAELGLPSWAALSLLDWAAEEFATFTFEEELSAENVALLVDALVVALAGASPDYEVTVEVFELPA